MACNKLWGGSVSTDIATIELAARTVSLWHATDITHPFR